MEEFYLKPKIISALKGYNKSQLINDVIAGIIVAIIALPLSIALAIASGVEPANGLYTAIAAGFFVSLFGGSNIQIADMVHSVVLLLVILFLVPYAGLIPMPSIATILFMVAYNNN